MVFIPVREINKKQLLALGALGASLAATAIAEAAVHTDSNLAEATVHCAPANTGITDEYYLSCTGYLN